VTPNTLGTVSCHAVGDKPAWQVPAKAIAVSTFSVLVEYAPPGSSLRADWFKMEEGKPMKLQGVPKEFAPVFETGGDLAFPVADKPLAPAGELVTL